MKIRLAMNEMYPVFYVTTANSIHDLEVEITEDEYDFVRSAINLHEQAQKFLERKYKENK